MSTSSRSLLGPSTPSSSSASRSRHHHQNRHSTGAGGAGPIPSALGARLTQLMDEADHRDCSQGNKKALVAETLDRLRELTDEISEDDWMYDDVGKNGAGTSLGGNLWSGR
mmetsp:Transcript_1116/g.3052  ORF Transcript_1116/g.3052 Transcript_1116/m.3052 type:complete len:111 (-) Transcript_1116:480-812(-)|eukprot:CAMPEP_0113578582 /NCGR_PEP_ID=MMETSP0015_2-20120614/29572_1 /TAXON_ID=2838 /ORGANISM="Odontella" /LENGTH=110 /DNA_ID=CAMNT_0000482425 /DNA_START=43 /DNA_END=375 /DNA_ORIENTATION=- /assembly_acc=CAM_ASM_000160